MIKKITSILFLLFVAFVLFGCGNKSDNQITIITGDPQGTTKFTIVFLGNGGTLVSGEEIQEITKSSEIVEPVYEYEGYKFKGWDTDLRTVTSKTTIKALWEKEADKYNLVIKDYYYKNGKFSDYIAEVEEKSHLNIKTPEDNDDYIFEKFEPELPVVMPSNELEIVAVWKENTGEAQKYTLTIKNYYNNYDGLSDLVEIHDVGDLILISNPKGNSSYQFKNYSDSIPTTMPKKNVEITANWEHITANLGGYTIKIAVSNQSIGTYKNSALISQIKSEFNCNILFVAYPDDVPWGPARWNYILNKSNAPDYDFYQDSYLNSRSVINPAVYDVYSWYEKYGNDLLSMAQLQEYSSNGSLYGITPNIDYLAGGLYYNVGLFNEICAFDSSLEEPATMFLNGKWSIEDFKVFCLKAQNVLNSYLSTVENKYYVLSGYPSYYLTNMVGRNGKGIADLESMKIHINDTDFDEALHVLVDLYCYEGFDPDFRVDSGSSAWQDGRALFSSGEAWFVNFDNRWPSNMWGRNTHYGFVPFPAPSSVDKDDLYFTAVSGEDYVMARNRSYSGYGSECTAENIFRAVIKYFALLKKTMDDGYQNSLGSSASKEAYAKVFSNTSVFYFDPMSYISLIYNRDFSKAVENVLKNNSEWPSNVNATTLRQEFIDKYH